jgi:hypothetical protein
MAFSADEAIRPPLLALRFCGFFEQIA